MPASSLPQDAQVVSGSNQTSDCRAPQQMGRVLSVSPRSGETCAASAGEEISNDQCASNAESLQKLIADANAAAERLERAAEQASQREAQATKLANQLQERLQLSAQMLKAFQSQITRIEATLSELRTQEKKTQVAESRARQRIGEANTHIDAALQRFRSAVDEIGAETIAKIQRVAGSALANESDRDSQQVSDSAGVARDLTGLTAIMRDVAERIAHIAEAHAVSATPAPSREAPELQIEVPSNSHGKIAQTPDHPLRFQKFAGTA